LLQDVLLFICSPLFDPSDAFDIPHAPPVRCAYVCRLQLLLMQLQSALICSSNSLSPGFAYAPDGGAIYVCGQCVCSTVDEALQSGTDVLARLLLTKIRGHVQVVVVPLGGSSERMAVCGIGENTCLIIFVKILQHQQKLCSTMCIDCSAVGEAVARLHSSGTTARLLADMLQRSQGACGSLSCTETVTGTCSSYSTLPPSSCNICLSSLAPAPSPGSLPHWPSSLQTAPLIIPVAAIKRPAPAPPMFEYLCANACGVRRPLWALALRDRVCGSALHCVSFVDDLSHFWNRRIDAEPLPQPLLLPRLWWYSVSRDYGSSRCDAESQVESNCLTLFSHFCSEETFWTDGNIVLQCTSSSFACASIVRLHPDHLAPTQAAVWRSLYACPLHITAALARCEL
jgi:hypothetical protein